MSKATIRPIQLRPEERCDCGEPLAGRCIACTVSAYHSERASPSAASTPQELDSLVTLWMGEANQLLAEGGDSQRLLAAAYLVCATQLNERLRAALVSRSSDAQ